MSCPYKRQKDEVLLSASPTIPISQRLSSTEDFFQTKKEPTVRWANGLRIDKLLSIQLLAEC